MPSSAWKGYISFGLISVPIKLYAAARSSHVAFHEIHRKCGTRVHQQLYCPYDKEVVSRDEIAMGYETEKDKYVLVDSRRAQAAAAESSTAMEIVQFTRLSEVDPVYFETSYFSVPEEAGQRAYALLLQAMDGHGLCRHRQSHHAPAGAHGDYPPLSKTVLILHTIYYPNEIHGAKGYGQSNVEKRQETGSRSRRAIRKGAPQAFPAGAVPRRIRATSRTADRQQEQGQARAEGGKDAASGSSRRPHVGSQKEPCGHRQTRPQGKPGN